MKFPVITDIQKRETICRGVLTNSAINCDMHSESKTRVLFPEFSCERSPGVSQLLLNLSLVC